MNLSPSLAWYATHLHDSHSLQHHIMYMYVLIMVCHVQGRQSVYLFTLPLPSPPHSDTPMDYKIKSALVCDTLSLAGVPLQDPFTAVRAASAGYTRAAAKRSGPSVQLVSEQLRSTAAVGRLLHMLYLYFMLVWVVQLMSTICYVYVHTPVRQSWADSPNTSHLYVSAPHFREYVRMYCKHVCTYVKCLLLFNQVRTYTYTSRSSPPKPAHSHLCAAYPFPSHTTLSSHPPPVLTGEGSA